MGAEANSLHGTQSPFSSLLDSRSTLRYLKSLAAPKPLTRAFRQLSAHRVDLNSFHYNAVINSWVKGRRWSEALASLRAMGLAQVEADLASYNTLASPCGEWRLSLSIRQCSLRHSFTCNLIGCIASVSSCAEVGHWQRAQGLLLSLLKTDLQADERPGSALINACEKCSNWTGALSFLEWMPWSLVTPNRITFNAASSASGGTWWRSFTLLAATEEPNRISYNSMLSALEKGAEWSKALSWLAQLQLHRVGADEISYNASLSACGQAGRWEYAANLLQVLEGHGQPDEISFAAAVSACDQKGRWRPVLDLLQTMSASLLVPNQICLNSVISSFESGHQWRWALEGLMEMIWRDHPRDEQSYASSISACAKCSQPWWSLRLLRWMESEGLPSNELSRALCIESCLWGGHPFALKESAHEVEQLSFTAVARMRRWSSSSGGSKKRRVL
ncbi:unnamed protein product [Durusdinium trenchii]|uniref:Pentatricopeptide repeat-containing protein n=1 Tax=Durusdinium trenchii TaxID=1381693 RepID=A0ABP0SCY3_9DINO